MVLISKSLNRFLPENLDIRLCRISSVDRETWGGVPSVDDTDDVGLSSACDRSSCASLAWSAAREAAYSASVLQLRHSSSRIVLLHFYNDIR